MELILQEIFKETKSEAGDGHVAKYIPELAGIDPNKFGIHLCKVSGEEYGVGDHQERFSIQSISKVLSLSYALSLVGSRVWERVGVEPSGNPFNSLVQLEYEEGIPRNPLINAGAMVVCDILVENLKEPKKEFLEFVRDVAGNQSISYNEKVANSEKLWGHRNVALINLMKSFGNINNPVDSVLDFYFFMCSLEMSCSELAKTFLFLANDGKCTHSRGTVITHLQSKRVNALMLTCGFYDEAGEFAFRIGLPGKSGVGGGIVAVHPDDFSVAIWSPRLNSKGNSILGIRALELLTSKTNSSIF